MAFVKLDQVIQQYVRRIMPYQEYLKTDHWQEVRRDALEFAGQRCQLCFNSDGVEIHHRTYVRLWNERPADVIALCDRCHRKFHRILDEKNHE